MSITITTHQREGLPTLQQLKDILETKRGTQRAAQIELTEIRRGMLGATGAELVRAVQAEAEADARWQAAWVEVQMARAVWQQRLDDVAAFPLEPGDLGNVFEANPGIELLDALDILFRRPTVHTFDQPMTEDEFAAIFAGRDDELAAVEAHDRMAEEVDLSDVVEEPVEPLCARCHNVAEGVAFGFDGEPLCHGESRPSCYEMQTVRLWDADQAAQSDALAEWEAGQR